MKYPSHKFVIASLMLFLPLGALAVLSSVPVAQLTKVPSISSGQTYFAKVDANGNVLTVIAIDQASLNTGRWGNPADWIQTTKDGSIRKHYAEVAGTYDRTLDAFISPKPAGAVTFNPTKAEWVLPAQVSTSTPA